MITTSLLRDGQVCLPGNTTATIPRLLQKTVKPRVIPSNTSTFSKQLRLYVKTVGFLLLAVLFGINSQGQITRYAGTQAQLNTAITASASGDIISITQDIVVNAQVLLSKSITIEGNNYTITVPVTGLDEQGRFNTGASNFRVFNCNTGATTVNINNLTIKGGNLTTNGEHGAAVNVSAATATLTLNNCIISNSVANATVTNATSNGGGAVRNAGILIVKNCYLRRNAAQFGGALLNEATGIAFIENTTMTENRATSSGGGGGAIENRAAGNIYFNNATLSNNQSLIVGGAINNFNGTLYFINSSATGNVVYGSDGSTLVGGALSNNGASATMFIVNSLMAHNYRRSTGSVTNPTGFILDDMTAFSNQAGVRILYSVFHAAMPSGMGANLNNVQYTGAANGSNNSIFSGGDLSRITDGTGFAIGTASVYRPFLYSENDGTVGPTLKSGSFVSLPANRGTRTRYANNAGVNTVLSYWDGTSYVAVNGRQIGTAANEVLHDQVGTSRPNPPARGSMEAIVTDLFMVKIDAVTNGTATGGSAYGDVYPSGTQLTVTAIPNAGYSFTRWDWVLGGTGVASTSNPYTFTVNQDITIVPVFTALSPGTYSITYAGNNNTAGTAPVTQTYSAATTISTAGTLTRKGYVFAGWNTAANGSGISYNAGVTYSSGTNLVLYAQWQEVLWIGSLSGDGITPGNWQPAQVPASGTSFAIAANAFNNLVLPANYDYDEIIFRNAGRKIVLGNYNLKVNRLTGANTNNYVSTNGTGRLRININSTETKIFPVGNTAYNGVSITNNTGSADEFAVRVVNEVYANGTNGAPITANRIQRTWDIDKLNPNTGSGVDFVFNWNTGETAGTMTTPTLFHYDTKWRKQSGSTTVNTNSLTYTGYTGTFSPFAVVDGTFTLPLSWLSFTAEKQAKSILLNWATAIESNTKDFLVQHSTNGNQWNVIGNIVAAGNSSVQANYQFLHTSPVDGNNFYRLLQRDNDGAESFSKIIQARMGQSNDLFKIIGNPVVDGVLKVQMSRATTLSIFNANGVLVLQKQVSEGLQQIPVTILGKGNYFLKGDNQTEKFLIQ